MKTSELKTAIQEKHDEVMKEIKNRKNKDVREATGLAAAHISGLKSGKYNILKSSLKIIDMAEKLGVE